MTHWYFQSIVGLFVLDQRSQLVEEFPFSTLDEFQHQEKALIKLKKKYPQIQPLPAEKVPVVLPLLRNKKYFPAFYQHNLLLTKQLIRASVDDDDLIMQTISNLEEVDKVSNILVKRLREWYGLYLPELSQQLPDHETFIQFVQEKSKLELMKELHLSESMGADLDPVHVQEFQYLTTEVAHLYALRKNHEAYLRVVMQKYCPNLLELAGPTIGAKLIELAKGLRRLAELPSSTLQLLGAEKALFRHLKTGSKSPKYGIIINHPFIQNAPRDKKGKAARLLADKLSFCARLDYFKGEFKAPQYQKELAEVFSK